MHFLAGALLVIQFVLMWILDRTVALKGLNYVAIALWLIAMALISLPMLVLRRKGQVPQGESFVHTDALVDTGIYAAVRHPLYLGWMLMYLVVLLLNPNWVLAGIAVLGIACAYGFARQEEQSLITKFGESYRDYMQRVPRFNLVLGLVRMLGNRERWGRT